MKKTTPNNNVQFDLAKREHKEGYYMCWYKLKYGKRVVKFRSDEYVPEDVENKLRKFHCTCTNLNDLSEKCFNTIEPYLSKVMEDVVKFLDLTVEEQKSEEWEDKINLVK